MHTEVPTDPFFFGGGDIGGLLTPPIFEAKKQYGDKSIL